MNANLLSLALLSTTLSGYCEGEWLTREFADSAALQENLKQLDKALRKSGGCWTEAVAASLQEFEKRPDSAALQATLDPQCIALLSIDAQGKAAWVRSPTPPRLLEQGWKMFLVKIINRPLLKTSIRFESPNARPKPTGPSDEISSRWLGVDFPNQAPLNPNLLGTSVEYRLVHLWADQAGSKAATFTAQLGDGSTAGQGRIWNFERDTEGWTANDQCKVEPSGGRLKVSPHGSDPWISAAVRLPPGEKILRFHAWNSGNPHWEVFWMTTTHPQPDGRRRAALTVFQDVANGSDYVVRFNNVEELTGLRIDPGSGGDCHIDDIELISLDPPGPEKAAAEFDFVVEPSHKVTFAVRDEHSQPTIAAFLIKDHQGRAYPWPAKRLAPDFFFQQQIYRKDGESLQLPAGKFHLTCRRGPESIPEQRELVVTGPVTIDYQMKRWIDPSLRGWFSGDHHIHAAGCQHYENPTQGVLPEDMQRHIVGEDLKVGCNLTWGPCFDFQKQFFTGRIDKVSQYPYLLRYDVEVSGFGSHQSGHLCLLRLREQIIPGGESKQHWPTLGINTLKWAKAQGAICGPAHSANGLAGEVARLPYPDGPNGIPSFAIPRFDGIGAMEYVVDITQDVPGPDGKLVPAVDFISTMDTDRRQELNMWYHTLNCGYRVRASGETDFPCITGEKVGDGRVYVHQRGKLDFDDWCEGIRDGRSYVSDGTVHLMDFAVNGVTLASGKPDSTLKASGKIRAQILAAGFFPGRPGVKVELVVNGYPVADQTLPETGETKPVEFETEITTSSWIAIRAFPHAHTNPIWITINDRPIRSKPSLEWMLQAVDQCWKQKERTYAEAELPAARALYESARTHYRKRLSEAGE